MNEGATQTIVSLGTKSSALLRFSHYPRQPVDRIVMEDLAQNRLRQRETLVVVSHVLHLLVRGEEFPIALVSLIRFRQRLFGIVLRHDNQVGSIEDAVLVFD